MQVHRTIATLTKDGVLTLEGLPFRAGAGVEVIVLGERETNRPPTTNRYPLHGTPVRYENPFMPVAELEWEAGR